MHKLNQLINKIPDIKELFPNKDKKMLTKYQAPLWKEITNIMKFNQVRSAFSKNKS